MPFDAQFRALMPITGQHRERCSPGRFCASRISPDLECCTGQLSPPETKTICSKSLEVSLAQPHSVPASATLAPVRDVPWGPCQRHHLGCGCARTDPILSQEPPVLTPSLLQEQIKRRAKRQQLGCFSKIKILLGRKKATATPGIEQCFLLKKNGFEESFREENLLAT